MFSFFEKLIDPFPNEPSGQPPDTLAAYCWHYTKDIWPFFAVISTLSAIISILEVILYGFLGNLVDWLSDADKQTFLALEQGKLIAMAAIILVAVPTFSFIHSLIVRQSVLANSQMITRWLGHRYLLGQSYTFYQDDFAGRIATKVMQSAGAIREIVLKLLDVLVYVSIYFLGAIILVGSFNLWLVLPFLIWLLCYVIMLRVLLPKLSSESKKFADSRSLLTGRIVDSYTNIMTVKLFAHTGKEELYARDAMQVMLKDNHQILRYLTVLELCLSIINALLLFSVSWIALWLWLTGAGTVGAVAVSATLVLKFFGMSHWIMWEMWGLFENIGIARDSMSTIAQKRDVQDRPDAGELDVHSGGIHFDNIKFHYGKKSGVIERLSLQIKPGEKVGIVGRSGSGKTTLMNILLRLYDLEGGRILIDGQDIANLKQDRLRAQIGVVSQDTSLLHRSIADNIAYGFAKATRKQIITAAKRANAHEFISSLEDKKGNKDYDVLVGERGVKLSGGQRQRIAIARMFLKDAPILLLDEATSALDSEVEAAIQENLYALMEGKTVIAIAHRLSTISSLDRLVVMDQGAIIEQGTHDELIKARGLYAQLWSRQSGGFLAEEVEV